MTAFANASAPEPSLAYIGLGANLGPAMATIGQALNRLNTIPFSQVVQVSCFYRTPAWGRQDQPDFINAAAALMTQLSPQSLLQALLNLESQAGRVRPEGDRWGPRILDLDLLLYADQCIDQPLLKVPHPYLHLRAFVLAPLNDIASDRWIPGHGRVIDLLTKLGDCGIVKIS